MRPTRRTQPYRKGPREAGDPLRAMLIGSPEYLPNPQDVARETQVQARKQRAAMFRQMLR